MAKVILTYGTFDMYHEGHSNVIKNSKKKGYKLGVGIATDEYVKRKGKQPLLNFKQRKKLIEADPLVDFVFEENNIEQWKDDIVKYDAELIRISEEHIAEIKNNKELDGLNIEFFPRTPNISTTNIKDEFKNKRVVITYGTYDLLHVGHNNIFKNAKSVGDILIAAVSTDEFNSIKGKKAYESFAKRINNVRADKYVDFVIPEDGWDQKEKDFKKFNVNVLVMGGDWLNKFNDIDPNVEVKIFDRTEGISSTQLRNERSKNN